MYSSRTPSPSSTGASLSSSVSAPVPLSSFASGATLTDAAFAYPMPFFARQTSTQSTTSRYDAYQTPTPLSASSLDQGTVYRGVVHEPTAFAQPAAHHQTQLWQAAAPADAFHHQQHAPAKKLELSEVAYPTAYTNATAYAAVAPVDLPAVPAYVERFTSFYSAAVPAVISKALRIAFQTMSEMRVDFAEEGNSKFRCQCYAEDNESVHFIARVYKSGSAAPAPYLVEFQRRQGDSVAFFRLFQKVLRSCAAVHHCPYETTFSVSGMSIAPLTASYHSSHPPPAAVLPLPSALRLDLPAVSSLCNMVASDCIESKRESAKVLAKVSQTSDLFPPTLERQTSTPSASAASKAIWSAIVNVLTSGDSECARLGASILRNCLARGDASMLVDHLQADSAVVRHLLSLLHQQADDELATRELRRQVAAVLKHPSVNAIVQTVQ